MTTSREQDPDRTSLVVLGVAALVGLGVSVWLSTTTHRWLAAVVLGAWVFALLPLLRRWRRQRVESRTGRSHIAP